MKSNNLTSKVLLAGLAGAGFVASAAQAQFVAPRGDLFWAARDVSDSGARGAFDIVVDLGSYTRFSGGTSAFLLGGGNPSEAYQGIGQAVTSENRFADSDVLATFGNLDNIISSVFGVNSGASPTANSSWFLSKARLDVNTPSTPWNRASAFSQGGTGNKMETVRNNAINGGVDFSNTATKEDVGVSAAYGNASISPFTGYNAMEANTGPNGAGSFVRLDLYDVPFGTGASDFLGFFEYQRDGDLWWVPENYTPTPVPEPSAYGVFAGSLLLAMALHRKMTKASA